MSSAAVLIGALRVKKKLGSTVGSKCNTYRKSNSIPKMKYIDILKVCMSSHKVPSVFSRSQPASGIFPKGR